MRIFIRPFYLASCLVALTAASAQGQAQTQANDVLTLQPTAADTSAASQSTGVMRHALFPAGYRARRDGISDGGIAQGHGDHNVGGVQPTRGVRYPGTLTYQGGPVMTTAVEHPIYLFPSNGACPTVAACWGDPRQFLRDLGKSEFIHVTDQYVGTTAGGRYTVGVSGNVNYTIPANPLVDTDIQAIVHSMVVKDGGLNGYGHEYHVFLPPGQDECFDNTYTVCYSPDNPPAFYFCAYHSSVDFSDVGHVVYSVEPYTNVPGCNALQPDGSTPSSQNSILSHEMIESITDPDGNAWWNLSGNLDLYGYEIGDECQWVYYGATTVGFLLDAEYLNGSLYYLQSEYNDNANGCTDGPGNNR